MRRFALTAAVVALLSCAASCASRGSLPAGAELIPHDVTFALSFDLQALMSSELYRRYGADERLLGMNRRNFYKFAEATGLDPSRDISRILFLARTGEGSLEEMSALVTGTFDGGRVRDYLISTGLPRQTAGGMDIFELILVNGRCRFCLAVVDASTAAFGDGETLRKIAELRSGAAEGLAAQAGPARLLGRVGRHAEAWGFLQGEDLRGALTRVLGSVSADGSQISRLGPLREAAFSFDTAEPMRLVVEIAADTDEDALLVADVLKGAEAFGRLALKEARPELARLVSDLIIDADTGIVRVAGSIPAGDVSTVARLLGAAWPEPPLTLGTSPPEPPPSSSEPGTSR